MYHRSKGVRIHHPGDGVGRGHPHRTPRQAGDDRKHRQRSRDHPPPELMMGAILGDEQHAGGVGHSAAQDQQPPGMKE
jgi:hypothetical protein